MFSALQIKPGEILNCIIDGAKEKAILLGLLNAKLGSRIYEEQEVDKYEFSILKTELPNKKSRLDVLCVNNIPVGTIVSSEIIPGLYHMVGMYVTEKYRSGEINDTLPGVEHARKENKTLLNPAEFLLWGYLKDVVSREKKQVSLEVIDGNVSAWRFYEKRLYWDEDSERYEGFELMTQRETKIYAQQRGKKIKRWVKVLTQSNRKGYAVHWSHIPEYGPGTERWAVNRVYLIKSSTQKYLLEQQKKSRFFSAITTGYTIIRFGNFLGYLIFKIKGFTKKA